MSTVEINVEGDIAPEAAEAARRRLASLQQYTDLPFMGGRLTLRHVQQGRTRLPYVADARVTFDGRHMAAHTAAARPRKPSSRPRSAYGGGYATSSAPTSHCATSPVRSRGRSRTFSRTATTGRRRVSSLRRSARSFVAAPTPTMPPSTYEAIADMLDLDEEFHLFRHVRTGEDVVVYRRDDGRIGLIHPPGSVLADESDDVVLAEPSRYSEPLTLAQARAEMDVVNHRFLYYIDAADDRGRGAVPAPRRRLRAGGARMTPTCRP